NRLTRDELFERLRLVGGFVLVACLKPEGGVLEGAEELAELGSDEQIQRSPSWYYSPRSRIGRCRFTCAGSSPALDATKQPKPSRNLDRLTPHAASCTLHDGDTLKKWSIK